MVFFGSALFWVLLATAVLVICLIIAHVIRSRQLEHLLDEPLPEAQNQILYTASQLEELRHILAGTGYAYDFSQNIFYSVLYPWQRKYGYCSLYDESSAPLGMVIDCEPVRFDYDGKHWMIEFWKGQYGLTSGAEIGIYNTTEPDIDIPGVFNGTFYHCARDDDTLSMTYTLLRKDKVLFTRAGRHWWLTGFMLGMFSKPSALTMEASITFRDHDMQTAFLSALREIGYTQDEIRYSGNTVLVLFTKPHTAQPLTRRGFIGWAALRQDRNAVGRYRRLTKDSANIVDILDTLKERAPVLYELAINMGRHKDFYRPFDFLRPFVDMD